MSQPPPSLIASIKRIIFPLPIANAAVAAVASAALSYYFASNNTLTNSTPTTNETLSKILQNPIVISAISTIGMISVLYIITHTLLKQLLSYQDYLTEGRGKVSTKTKAWGMLLSLATASSKETFAYQPFLPRLPVPELKDTIKRWLDAMEPFCKFDDQSSTKQDFETLKKRAMEFINSKEGQACQKFVQAKAASSDNYVGDWWLQYAYLRDRSSIMINSNYYAFTLDMEPPTKRPTSRAAFYLHRWIKATHDVAAERLQVQKAGAVPMCMNQYKQVLSLTRIPGKEMDELVYYNPKQSRHVIVIRKGRYYKVEVYGKVVSASTEANMLNPNAGHFKVVSASQIESAFDRVIADADQADTLGKVTESERNLSLLTGWNRTQWAQVREELFLKNPTNAAALKEIESAIMVISFDDETYNWEDLSAAGHSILHGGAGARNNRWYDKSVTMCVSNNAMIGLNCEHSFADAPCIGHFCDECMSYEMQEKPYEMSLEGGRVSAKIGSHPGTIRLLGGEEGKFGAESGISHINFDISSSNALPSAIAQAEKDVGAAADDLDLCIGRFTQFGKNSVTKKFGLSPDAFIQAALHLAYYRMHGEMTHTYESATARLFLNGRTETIRSASKEMFELIRAVDKFCQNASSTTSTASDCKKLFKAASARHSSNTALAMSGKGVDRHLFALYVASMATSSDSATKFLREDVMSKGWKLSTSQVPYGQSTLWKEKDAADKYRRANGGFGPVHAEGYGISYVVAGTDRFVVHVSSKFSCAATSSKKMLDAIFKAFEDFEKVMMME